MFSCSIATTAFYISQNCGCTVHLVFCQTIDHKERLPWSLSLYDILTLLRGVWRDKRLNFFLFFLLFFHFMPFLFPCFFYLAPGLNVQDEEDDRVHATRVLVRIFFKPFSLFLYIFLLNHAYDPILPQVSIHGKLEQKKIRRDILLCFI